MPPQIHHRNLFLNFFDAIINWTYVRHISFKKVEPYSSDLSIVSLDSRMTAPYLPGKFVDLLGAGKAFIANVPEVNDVHWMVKGHEAGLTIDPGDIDFFEEAIRSVLNDIKALESIGSNGRRFLEANMDLERTDNRYEEIFGILKRE